MTIDFTQVHNYYAPLVLDGVARHAHKHPEFSHDMLIDVACVALNSLPSRYVRHDVYIQFYLTEHERQAIAQAIENALSFAFAFVKERATKPG